MSGCDVCNDSDEDTCICFGCMQDVCDECQPNSDNCVGCARLESDEPDQEDGT